MTIAAMITQQIVLKRMVGRFAPRAIRLMRVPTGTAQHDDAAQRDNAGDSDLNQEDAQQHGADERLGGESSARADQHALAAFEAEKIGRLWPIMQKMAARYAPQTGQADSAKPHPCRRAAHQR